MTAHPFPAPSPRRRLVGPHLPVVENLPVRLGAGERMRAVRLATRVREAEPDIDATAAFEPGARQGFADAPTLVIHDMTWILAAEGKESSVAEYRALHLAGPGDVVVMRTPRIPAFEDYCRNVLGLGAVEVVRLPPPRVPTALALQCRDDAGLMARLTERARQHGGLNVHPYIGTGAVWVLAAAVGEDAGVDVHVAAPPPNLTQRVNDKIWFTDQARALLGERALPPTTSAASPAALAGRVRALARQHERVGLKMPTAAGATGNVVLDAAPLRGLSLAALRDRLLELIRTHHWPRPFPMLVSVWETPVVTSPSVQLWIPRRGAGPPVVEGVFEQRVTEPAGEFCGAAPARLPDACARRMAREAALLGTFFQELGYFGRCSFDAILVGRDALDAELHWIECNGRWGGTSVPMTLVNRLTGSWAKSPFVATCDGPLQPFPEVLERTRDLLYHPGRRTGIVYVTPADPGTGRPTDLLALGDSPEDAARRARPAVAMGGA